MTIENQRLETASVETVPSICLGSIDADPMTQRSQPGDCLQGNSILIKPIGSQNNAAGCMLERLVLTQAQAEAVERALEMLSPVGNPEKPVAGNGGSYLRAAFFPDAGATDGTYNSEAYRKAKERT